MFDKRIFFKIQNKYKDIKKQFNIKKYINKNHNLIYPYDRIF